MGEGDSRLQRGVLAFAGCLCSRGLLDRCNGYSWVSHRQEVALTDGRGRGIVSCGLTRMFARTKGKAPGICSHKECPARFRDSSPLVATREFSS